MARPAEQLRTLGLARTSLALGIAVATGVFFYMGIEGHRGEVVSAIVIEALLITFVQQGISRRERRLFLLAAVGLGLLALAAGSLVARALG